MKRKMLIYFFLAVFVLTSCGKNEENNVEIASKKETFSTPISTTKEITRERISNKKISKLKGKALFKIKNGTLIKYLGGYEKEAEIVLPKSVKRIGKRAFAVDKKSGKQNKTLHIKIGKNVKLSECSFEKCSSMKIEFEEGREVVEKQAFMWGPSPYATVEVTLPSSVKVIQERAFYSETGDSGILQVQLVEGLERIEDEALAGVKVTKIPDTVRYIGNGAIGEVEKVENILPSHLEHLGEYSMKCYGGKIKIPSSVKNISVNAVEWIDCQGEEYGYDVAKDNPYYKSDEKGWLYSKDGTKLFFAYMLGTDEVVVPKGVKYVYKKGINLYDDDVPEDEKNGIMADSEVIFK